MNRHNSNKLFIFLFLLISLTGQIFPVRKPELEPVPSKQALLAQLAGFHQVQRALAQACPIDQTSFLANTQYQIAIATTIATAVTALTDWFFSSTISHPNIEKVDHANREIDLRNQQIARYNDLASDHFRANYNHAVAAQQRQQATPPAVATVNVQGPQLGLRVPSVNNLNPIQTNVAANVAVVPLPDLPQLPEAPQLTPLCPLQPLPEPTIAPRLARLTNILIFAGTAVGVFFFLKKYGATRKGDAVGKLTAFAYKWPDVAHLCPLRFAQFGSQLYAMLLEQGKLTFQEKEAALIVQLLHQILAEEIDELLQRVQVAS